MNVRKTALMILLLCWVISGFAQLNRLVRDVNRTNKIEIRFLKNGDHYIWRTADKNHLSIFKDLLKKSKNNPPLKCDSTVEIVYLQDSKQLFRVYFSSHASGSSLKRSSIFYTLNGQKVVSLPTYNAGTMIDEIYYQHSTEK